MLVHVPFAENYRNDQQNEIQSTYFGHQSFSLITSFCYYKDDGNILQQKSIVIVTENFNYNRVPSMSSLRNVFEIAGKSLRKSFRRLITIISRFILKLSASTLFLENKISWFYNERYHSKARWML